MIEIKRKINQQEAIQYVKSKTNEQFLSELPISLEEIADKYARRRKDPYISPSIPDELKQKMLEYRQSDGEYLLTLAKISRDLYYGINPSDNKKAYILLSQTGAGKTLLRQKILSENSNLVRIDNDYLKAFRSDAEEIRKKYPSAFGILTGIDSYDQMDDITNMTISLGYNIILESAPSKTKGIIGVDLKQLANNGYNTSIEVMAVGDLVSALAIHKRYEKDLCSPDERIRKSAKLTDLARHDDSYSGLLQSLKKEFGATNYQNVRVYRRGKKDQFPVEVKLEENDSRDIIDLIEHERRGSDLIYSFSTGENSFLHDYVEIAKQMQKRNAPEVEKKQLEKIYSYYEDFLKKYDLFSDFEIVKATPIKERIKNAFLALRNLGSLFNRDTIE